MKRIFSSLLLLFIFPFKKIKKAFKDNFLSGLILGAVFSLFVNVVSMKIQGTIEKQRILEAIENEILTNTLQASNQLTENINMQKNNKGINNFHTFKKYSRDLWEQSTEPLQYVAQLDQKTQIAINGYYTLTVPGNNLLQEKLELISNKLFTNCFDEYGSNVIKGKEDSCNKNYYILLDLENNGVIKYVANEGFRILKLFHPTQDRLNSPLLRFLMGTESMRILSGK